MKRLFALMLVVAFTFSMVTFAQDAPKPAKTAKAKVEKKVEVKTEAAKKEVVKEAAPVAEKVAKHKVKKAAKKVEAAADKK